MSTDAGNRTPKMKRLVRAAFLLLVIALIAGSLTRDWLGFWPSTVIIGLLLAAALAPLAVAARRERDELERRPDPSSPETDS
jgi:hypothetical protein